MRAKNLRLPAVMALLFSAITAIIIWSIFPRYPDSVSAAKAVSGGPVLVIDPGHGGLDGGAVSVSGRAESEINLEIAVKISDLASFFGAEHVLTRHSNTLDYPESADSIHQKKLWDQKQRAALINRTEGAVLLSVHQNTYPDPRPAGTEVYYGKGTGSDRFAALTQENLIRALCPENRRVAAPISEKIYLLRQIQCPAILAECGFLSNPEEAARLEEPAYQTALAVILTASYFQFLTN